MKTLLMFLFLLFPLSCEAQKTPPENVKVEQMVYTFHDSLQKVIAVDTFSTIEVAYYPMFAPYQTPVIYKRWWKEIEKCVNLYIPDAMEDKVQFYFVRTETFHFPHYFEPYIGYTFAESNMIYITFDHILDPEVVKHEMVHYLMYHNGDERDHPKDLYKRECGIHDNSH